jgi:hypothetical protein
MNSVSQLLNGNDDALENQMASKPAPFDTVEPKMPNLSNDENNMNDNREQFSNYGYGQEKKSVSDFANELVNNPTFLLNPEKMSAQGKLVFYGHLIVAVLTLIAALFDKRLGTPAILIFFNMIIMAFLQSNIVNCMIIGNCNTYSTILSLLTVFGQSIAVVGLLFYLMGYKK